MRIISNLFGKMKFRSSFVNYYLCRAADGRLVACIHSGAGGKSGQHRVICFLMGRSPRGLMRAEEKNRLILDGDIGG